MVRFSFVGGHAALDFADTVAWTDDGPVNDRLREYGDVVAWGVARGVLTTADARRMRARAEAEPLRAAGAFGQACGLRSALHDVFASAARGKAPRAASITAYNTALRDATRQLSIVWKPGRFEWQDDDASALDLVAHRVVWAAAHLLTSPQLERVGMCEGDDCGWLYLDTTKNHSRRWCTMSDCGSRAKARRYYARHSR